MTELLPGVETPSDAELISRVRGGDVAAYGELFSRHVDAARRLARQLMRGPDVDDLVSDAFAKTLNAIQAGGGPDVAFRAYLLTTVRRLHVDRIRASKRVQPSDDMTLYDDGQPFLDTAVASFENGAAARAFASLPERWQLVLWHLEVEGQKPADIAPLLGMSANSVSALAYRAREGLRQAFLTMHLADCATEQCRWVNQHLGAYVRKGLSRRDTTKVETHLDECRRCTAMYLELDEVNSDLAAIIAPLLLGAAAAGYLSSAGGAGLTGVSALFGRVRHALGSHGGGGGATSAGGAGATGGAAGAGAVATGSAVTAGGVLTAGGVIAAGIAAVTTAALVFGGPAREHVTDADKPTGIVQTPAPGPDQFLDGGIPHRETGAVTDDGRPQGSTSVVVMAAHEPGAGNEGGSGSPKTGGSGDGSSQDSGTTGTTGQRTGTQTSADPEPSGGAGDQTGQQQPVPANPTINLPGLPPIPVPPLDGSPDIPSTGDGDVTGGQPDGSITDTDTATGDRTGGGTAGGSTGDQIGGTATDGTTGGTTAGGTTGGTTTDGTTDGTATGDQTGTTTDGTTGGTAGGTSTDPGQPAGDPGSDPGTDGGSSPSEPGENGSGGTQDPLPPVVTPVTVEGLQVVDGALVFDLAVSGEETLPSQVEVTLTQPTEGITFAPDSATSTTADSTTDGTHTMHVRIPLLVTEPGSRHTLYFTVSADGQFTFVDGEGQTVTTAAPLEVSYSPAIERTGDTTVVVGNHGLGMLTIFVADMDRDALAGHPETFEVLPADEESTRAAGTARIQGVAAGDDPGTLVVGFHVPPGQLKKPVSLRLAIRGSDLVTSPFEVVLDPALSRSVEGQQSQADPADHSAAAPAGTTEASGRTEGSSAAGGGATSGSGDADSSHAVPDAPGHGGGPPPGDVPGLGIGKDHAPLPDTAGGDVPGLEARPGHAKDVARNPAKGLALGLGKHDALGLGKHDPLGAGSLDGGGRGSTHAQDHAQDHAQHQGPGHAQHQGPGHDARPKLAARLGATEFGFGLDFHR